jgi:hypothetical protein
VNHTLSAVPALARYLRRRRPAALRLAQVYEAADQTDQHPLDAAGPGEGREDG